ncbi:KPNA2_7 [Lepeophtheirus salmonis]|uniref:Importin subunit alpha n=1 Tax=Lepeophtheirus salmonis TaxID=72036 RepID=A0A7R8CNK3_LEPSM|nr:KPNA2_7 [Lepeophtheirus salmonis]CAF2876083.1 KPNA2_7 [Lepeophtheirus salmonis]
MNRENRVKNYKNKGKGQRTEVTVDLRKAKKEDALCKRRNVSLFEADGGPLSPINENKERTLSVEEISEGIIKDEDPGLQFKCVQSTRKILSKEKNPPINSFISTKNILPKLVECLSRSENPKLQFEAAWALTNIASGTSVHTKAVLDAGAVPHFINLISSPDEQVCEQAVWGLGNIAGDGPVMRDFVVNNGILKPLLRLTEQDHNVPFLRNVTWVVSNLCRNKDPYPPPEVTRLCLPVLAKLVHHTDNQVLADACWALSYVSDGSDDRIQYVVDAGVIPKLLHHMSTGVGSVLTPALRTIGNIVTGSDTQTDTVIAAGGLSALANLLRHEKMTTVKEATWAISNITAGNRNQIQKVIDENILPLIVQILAAGDFKAQKEAAWAVSNLTSCGSTEQTIVLLQTGVLKPLCDLLNTKDDLMVSVILDSITNVMSAAQSIGEVEKVGEIIEECGGLDKIESLQNHANDKIYEKALKIIQNFFSEGDDEDGNLAPEQNQNGFQFADPSTVPNGGGQGFQF